MTNYEKFQSMDFEEMARWFEEGNFDCDDTPWIIYFNDKYCKKCDVVKTKDKRFGEEIIYTYCELYDKCRYFKDEDGCPSDNLMIRLWLNGEV